MKLRNLSKKGCLLKEAGVAELVPKVMAASQAHQQNSAVESARCIYANASTVIIEPKGNALVFARLEVYFVKAERFRSRTFEIFRLGTFVVRSGTFVILATSRLALASTYSHHPDQISFFLIETGLYPSKLDSLAEQDLTQTFYQI